MTRQAAGLPTPPGASRSIGLGGPALNAALRVSLGYFLIEVLRHPDDPRFAGKAIPLRNLIVVGALSALFPALYVWRRPWPLYPWGPDNLYLSIFWLDMAGNSLNLYNRFTYFDTIPHGHGTGALASVLHQAFRLPALRAIGVANLIHALLEAQEYATDVFAGTHNVRGAWDSRNDLLAGALGTVLYLAPALHTARRQQARDR
jgi:hypothetical protein